MFHAITILRGCCFTTNCALNCGIIDYRSQIILSKYANVWASPGGGWTCVEKCCLKSYFTWPRGSVCGTGSTTQDDFSKRRKIVYILFCSLGDCQSCLRISSPSDSHQLLGAHISLRHHPPRDCHQPELHHLGQVYDRLRLLPWKGFEACPYHFHLLRHLCYLPVPTPGHLC